MKTTQSTVYMSYIAATPEKVWQALTGPALTRQYFMGRAIEIEPKVGGQFRLLMEDGRTDTEGVVKVWEPPDRLTVTWNVVWIPEFRDFPEAIVTYDLKPVAGMVKLTMTEEHPTPIEEEYLEGGRQGWPLILSGLKTLLENRSSIAKVRADIAQGDVLDPKRSCCMSKQVRPSFSYFLYVAATPERVWQALTDGAMTSAYWYGRRVESDWKVGAPVNFWYDKDGAEAVSDSGIVLECNAPRRLSYTFHVEFIDELRDAHPSRVAFDIEAAGGDTKLTVTHDEFEPGSKVLAGISQGWPIILCSLKSFVESGKPLASSSLAAAAQEAAA